MNEEPKNKPPYLPYTTFKNVTTNLNKNGIIPARIDKTVLAGQSGGMQSYIWAALRFFDLMDEGKAPTEEQINQVFFLSRVMWKAVLGLHYERKKQKEEGQLAIF